MESEKNLTRVFICIDVPDEVVKEIARVQEVLENIKFQGKMTELENLHLTLKFLGSIDAETLLKVQNQLNQIKFGPFETRLSEAGTFSHKSSPKIVWCKIGGRGIFELQQKIDASLKDLFKPEERFMSHLTVARVKYVKDGKGFTEYVRKMGVKDISWTVDKFYLKKSELRPLGSVYTTLAEFAASKEKHTLERD